MWKPEFKTQYHLKQYQSHKILGHKSNKNMQDMYAENYKIMMKEIKEYPNRQKEILCFCIGRLSIVNMPLFFKLFYVFNEIPIKIGAKFFLEIDTFT